jgi:hypothetical protein
MQKNKRGWNLRSDNPLKKVFRGEERTDWKGDKAGPSAKRARAQRYYPVLGVCQHCKEVPAVERHHIDENPGNNEPGNILMVCRSCHMQIDGRIHNLRESYELPPKICIICDRPSKPLRRGRCHACNEYFRRNGTERPFGEDNGIKLRGFDLFIGNCPRCNKPFGERKNVVGGICRSCYRHLYHIRTGN